jgi:hypothetical protein
MIELSDDIGLRPLRPLGPGPTPARSEVLLAGRPTRTLVSGCVLQAALRCTPGWLLFVTDDTPAEEMLSIHLLDADMALRDSALIGGAYSTGSFAQLRLDSPDRAHFRFIDGAAWTVRVWDRPHLALPFLPDARGVWRGARLRRHFEVRRQP